MFGATKLYSSSGTICKHAPVQLMRPGIAVGGFVQHLGLSFSGRCGSLLVLPELQLQQYMQFHSSRHPFNDFSSNYEHDEQRSRVI